MSAEARHIACWQGPPSPADALLASLMHFRPRQPLLRPGLQEAKDVLTRVAKPDSFTWSAVIAAHAKLEDTKQAVKLYEKMHSSSTVKLAAQVFVAAQQLV